MGHHHQSTGKELPTGSRTGRRAFCLSRTLNCCDYYGIPHFIDFKSAITGYHDEHLPSVDGGRVNGEEIRRQHKKGVLRRTSNLNLNLFLFTLIHTIYRIPSQ